MFVNAISAHSTNPTTTSDRPAPLLTHCRCCSSAALHRSHHNLLSNSHTAINSNHSNLNNTLSIL